MLRLTLLAKNFSFFYAIFKERLVQYLTLTDLPAEYKPRLYKLNTLPNSNAVHTLLLSLG
jgi:hypothetical protein